MENSGLDLLIKMANLSPDDLVDYPEIANLVDLESELKETQMQLDKVIQQRNDLERQLKLVKKKNVKLVHENVKLRKAKNNDSSN